MKVNEYRAAIAENINKIIRSHDLKMIYETTQFLVRLKGNSWTERDIEMFGIMNTLFSMDDKTLNLSRTFINSFANKRKT